MRTNLVKSINLVRRGSGVNLNLFRYAAMVLVLLAFGIGRAWAHGGACTAKLTVAKGTGSGSVYAATSSTATSGNSSVSANCGNSDTGTHTHTFFAHATPATGYKFVGWTTGTAYSEDADLTNPKTVSITSNAHGTVETTLYAHFAEKKSVDITFLGDDKGSYKYAVNGGSSVTVSSGGASATDVEKLVLSEPSAASGYAFAGFYQLNSDGTIVDFSGTNPEVDFSAAGTISIGARFVSTLLPKFVIKETGVEYPGLKAALAAATNGQTVVPIGNYTIDGEDLLEQDDKTYTIPGGVTLLIPYDAAYTVERAVPTSVAPAGPSNCEPYRTLTLDSGVKLNVMGSISVATKQFATNTTSGNHGVRTYYGFVDMKANSEIILQNGANLYAWGYISGDGSITAKSGSNVYEMFQLTDFRGGSRTSGMAGNSQKVFPFQQYYIQNIETKLTLEYGASEYVSAILYISDTKFPNTCKFIGTSGAMFTMTSGSVSKEYDKSKDRMHYVLDGNASLSPISLTFKYLIFSYTVSSDDYVMPINNNMTIDVKSGRTFTVTQDMSVLPDAEINIESGAKIVVNSGCRLYVYDKDEWAGKGCVFSNVDVHQLAFVGRKNANATGFYGAPTSRSINGDAHFNINGELEMNGTLYTTSHGADIKSSEGTGKISLKAAAGTETKTYQDKSNESMQEIPITAAQLHNGNGSYTKTASAPANTTVYYKNGHWGWKVTWKDSNGSELKTEYCYTTPSDSWINANKPENPTQDCMTFDTWERTSNDATNQERVYTAQYTTSTYAITYDKGANGAGSIEGGIKTCGVNFTLSTSKFTRTGYTQTGWSTEDVGAKAYIMGGTYTTNAKQTFYPFWTANEYNIEYKDKDDVAFSGTHGSEYPTKHTYGTPTALVNPTKEGYTFEGWFGDSECTGDALTEIGATAYSDDFTLYAKWKQNKVTVTWDATTNGGAAATPATTDVTPGSAVGELATTSKEGYTLAGWFTEPTGGTQVTTATIVSEAKTFYAQFTINSHTLTWNWGGGSTSSTIHTTGSVAYGTTIVYPTASTMTKENYVFSGWSLENATMPDENLTITAQWTPAVASVTAGGTTYYATLSAAFMAAKGKTNPTIKLLQDVEVSDNLTYDGANTCTLDLNGHNISRSGGTRLLIIDNESAIFTITDNSESKLGTLSLSTSSTSEAPFCVYVNNGNLQLEAGTIYTNSSAKNAGGVRTQTSGSSTFTMNGGTVHVETGTGLTGYGVQTLGTATINNGTVLVEAGAIGYALWVQNSGATVTVENGKFNVTGANAYASNAIAPNDALQLKGGYYSTKTMDNSATIDSKYVATNYHVFNTTAAEKAEIGSAYEYKVAEAYNVTFKDGDNNTIQSGLVEKNATPVYSGETPTKSQTAEYTYSFKGSWSPEISPVTAEATYTAQFNSTPRSYTLTWNLNGGNVQTAGTTAGSVAYGTSLSAPVVIKDGYSFTSWSPEVPSTMPAADAEYTATWDINEYTITFDSNGGSEVDPITQNYGTDVTAPADPTREGYTFKCWIPEVPSTMPLNGTTCVAQWEINSTLDVKENKIVTVSETTSVETTIVHEGGELEVASDKTLKTDVLIVEASATNSGQITGAGNVEVKASTGKAYFDLKLNTPARHWHAFGVPWAVDLNTDPLTEVDGDGNVVRTLTLGSHYEIVYYDTHIRATQGPSANCWKYLKHYDQVGQPIDEMTPGQGYMIAFTCSVQTVRFVKKAGAPVIYNEAVTVSAEGSGDNQGINALANPMAYHATLNAGPTVGYVHDGGEIGSDGYDEYDIDSKSFIVGKAVYIQVRSDATVEVEQSDAEQISKILAPARRKVVTDKEYLSLGDYYHVSISSATINGGSVYVLPEEDKEDKYVVGHDLAKFGMSTKKPQIWVNRYGVNLGLNTVAPINETAEFPVNLYAPTAGDYTITNNQSPMTNDEYIVYLTQNGEAIWNLSDSPYAISLPAGVNKTYGLRLTARKSPTIATGVDEAVVDAKNEIRKVLIDDKVFIIREGNVYSIDGQLVK